MNIALAYNESHRGHHASGHVEQPRRLDAVINEIEKASTWRSLTRVQTEPASLEMLSLVHTAAHVEHVVASVRKGSRGLDPDTYITADSLDAALEGIGCLTAVVREVVEGRYETGFAAIRPPGHHATATRSMGFCLFNNVAVAARWAQRELGIGRVLIVDFDVHHGNGTQDIFYEDGSVMYMSAHQSPFYPGTGDLTERGAGDGLGTTVNVPLPAGTGDATFEAVFQEILRPIALDFGPELILASAGYDSHWKDLLGGMRVTTRGFAHVTRELLDWARICCDGRLVAALEGGYHIEALARSVVATLQVMADPDVEVTDVIGKPPGEDAVVGLREIKDFLQPGKR